MSTATLTWSGVGCGGDVNVPSTAFLRPCTRCLQMLMLRSHGVGWGGVGCGGDVNVPSTAFLRPCTRCLQMLMLRSHGVGWGAVGMLTFLQPGSFDLAQNVYRCWCYAHMGWGAVGMLTFLQPRSFDLAQDVYRCWCYAHMGWGGVRWGCYRSFNRVPSTLHKMSTDVDATLTWGGVGCGGDVTVPSTAFLRPCTKCLQMLMLRSHGVGWGAVGTLTFLQPRSFDLAQNVYRCWCYAHMGSGGVRWGC